jgi:hypothetical protein
MTAVPFPYGQPRKKASPAPSVLLLYLMRRVDCRACGERVEETAVGDREAPADQGLYVPFPLTLTRFDPGVLTGMDPRLV